MHDLFTRFLSSDRALWRVWLYLWVAWVVLVPVLTAGQLLGFGNGQPGFGSPLLSIVLVFSFFAAPIYPFLMLLLDKLIKHASTRGERTQHELTRTK